MTQARAISITEFFIPDNQKEVVVGELSKQGRRGVSFVIGGLEWWVFILVSQLWPAFSLRLFCWEALALAAGFATAPDRRSYFIAILAGLVGLTLRDAHVYPIVKGPIAQGHDTLVALMFLVGVEVVEWIFAPSYALSGRDLLKGCLISMLTVSMVRATMRRPKNAPAFGASSFRYTRNITLLWMVTALVTKAMSPIPELFLFQDNLYAFMPMTFFVIARLMQMNDPWGRVIEDYVKGRPADDPREELKRMLKWLWTPVKVEGQRVSSHLFIEFLGFGSYALPMTGALLAWKLGYLPSSKMDWNVMGAAAISFVAMIPLWIAVRKANENMAAAAVKAATPKAICRRRFRSITPAYLKLQAWIQLRHSQEPLPIGPLGTQFSQFKIEYPESAFRLLTAFQMKYAAIQDVQARVV